MRIPPFRIALAAALLLGCTWLAAQGVPTTSRELPAESFRREPLAEDQVAAVLARAEHGTLVRLSVDEFDRIVRNAATGKSAESGPVLVEARYRAKCIAGTGSDTNLVGTAEWRIRHTSNSPASLELDPLQIALRQAKWSDGVDAVVYKSAGDANARLHIPGQGNWSLNLEWSARGLPEPGEVRFDIRVPGAAIASLDLELPTGLSPVLPQAEAVLAGPFPADNGSSAWRIGFGGLSRLELVLRKVGEGRPTLFSRVVTQQRLSDIEGNGRYEFQVESAKVGFTELTFDCDPRLTPTSVTVNNLLSWQVEGDGGNAPRVIVRLREPSRSATVVISGTIPLQWEPARWVSPAVWLRDAVQRSERLQIAVGPGLTFRDWRPGGFRLIRGDLSVDRAYVIESEPGPLPLGQSAPERPSLVLARRPATVWRAVQQADWAVRPGGEEWRVRTTATVETGNLQAMSFQVPADWQVEQIELNGQEVAWAVTGSNPRRLSIDLGRPVPAGQSAEVTAQFRRRGEAVAAMIRELVFPDLYPVGNSARIGKAVAHVDTAWDVVVTDPPPGEVPVSTGTGPNELERPLGSEPLSGAIVLRPRADRDIVDIEIELRDSGASIAAVARLLARPAGGTGRELRLWTPGPGPTPWTWRDAENRRLAEAIADARPVLGSWLLAASPCPPLGAAALAVSMNTAGGHYWSLRLPRPSDRPVTLWSDYVIAADTPSDQWPLPVAVGRPFHGTIRTDLSVSPDRLPRGLIPIPSARPGERRFRYGSLEGSAEITQRQVGSPPEVDGPRLLTRVEPDGAVRAEFRFRIRHWPDAQLPLGLPDGASSPVVTVGGRIASAQFAGSPGRLVIPFPIAQEWVTVTVRYELPRLQLHWFSRLPAQVPGAPFDTSSIRRVWHLSPDWRLGITGDLRPGPGTTDERLSLPLPDGRALLEPAVRPVAAGETARPAADQASLARALTAAFPGQELFIDSVAVSAAGLNPDFTVAAEDRVSDLLRNRGLMVAPCRGGILLTGPDELTRWVGTGAWSEQYSPSVEAALKEAASAGHDASGRFRTLSNWATEDPGDAEALLAPPGWSVWESDVGDATPLLLFRRDRVMSVVWLASIGLAVGWALLRSWPRLRSGLLLVWGLAAVPAFHLLPVASMDVVAPAVFLVVLGGLDQARQFRAATENSESKSGRRSVAVRAVALGLCGITAVAVAADPVPIVYEVRDRDSRPTAVLVPPALLAQLRRAKESPAPSPAVVITAASYTGSLDGNTARFRARFGLHAFEDRAVSFSLPIQGVRFRVIQLDGSEAGALDTTNDALKVTIKGRGAHVLDLDFSALVAGVGPEREVRFAVPEVPISKLSFELPRPALRLRTGNWRGSVQTKVGPQSEFLEADHGMNASVGLRWQADAAEKATDTRVRAALLWTVLPGSATLTGAFEYRITGGTVTQVHVEVPRRTEVYRVNVVGEAGPLGLGTPRVRDWTFLPSAAPAPRILAVEFLTPVTGRIVVQLELIATIPPGERVELGIPRPVKAGEVESQVAVALQGSDPPASFAVIGLTESTPDAFNQLWASVRGLAAPRSDLKVFRPSGPQAARINIDHPLPAAARSVTETVTWWAEPGRLTGQGEARWVSASDRTSCVEWTLADGVIATAVTAQNLMAWAQTGDRVQAWFDRPITNPVVSWRAGRSRSDPATLSIPVPTHPTAAADTVVTRVRPTAGWTIAAMTVNPSGESMAAEMPGEIAWRGPGGQAARLTLMPPPTTANLDIRSAVRPAGDGIQVLSSLDLSRLVRARPYLMSVVVHGADDADVRAIVPDAVVAKEVSPSSTGRRWDIGVPAAGAAGPIIFDIRPRPKPAGTWAVPRLSVRFGPRVEGTLTQRLELESDALTLTDAFGLTRLGDRAWRASDPAWRTAVVRRQGLAPGEHLRVTRAEVTAAQGGLRWLFRGRYGLSADEPGAATVRTPPGCRVLEAAFDGVPTPTSAHGLVRVPISPGPHTLSLLWESDRPTWQGARIDTPAGELVSPPTDWIVCVPPGQRARGADPVANSEARLTTVDEGPPEDREAFSRGVPHRYRVLAGQRLELNIEPGPPARPWWRLVAAIGCLLAGAVVSLFWPVQSGPEQAAAAGAVGAITFGPPGVLLWAIPVLAAVWRGRQLLGRLRRRQPAQEVSSPDFVK